MSPTKNYSGAGALDSPGFTMVELLIGLVLAMLLTAAMLLSYTFLVRSLIRSSNQQQLEAQSRKALQMLSQDVRMADKIAFAYDPTKDITQDSTWQTMPTARQVTCRLSVPNGSGGTYIYAVTYVYDTNAGVLTRIVSSGTSSGTPPSGFNANSLTLLTGLPKADPLTGLPKVGDPPLWSGFSYFDQLNLSAINLLCIKKIEIGSYTLTTGSPSAGTQSTNTSAPARLVLRSKHLVNY